MDELVLSRSLVGLDIIINIHTMTVWMALNLKPQALFYFFYFCTLPLVCCVLLIYLYLGMQFSPGPLLRGSGAAWSWLCVIPRPSSFPNASTQFRWPPSFILSMRWTCRSRCAESRTALPARQFSKFHSSLADSSPWKKSTSWPYLPHPASMQRSCWIKENHMDFNKY